MNKNVIILILMTLLAGGAGFAGGMYYQRTRAVNFAGSGFGRRDGQQIYFNGQGARPGMMNGRGFRPVTGEITSIDDKSMTIKMMDGSSKIVLLNDSTQINKAQTAERSDLKTGEQIAVFGTENTDGSVTASSIQLNPRIFASPSPSAK